jgi:hypothetical protein
VDAVPPQELCLLVGAQRGRRADDHGDVPQGRVSLELVKQGQSILAARGDPVEDHQIVAALVDQRVPLGGLAGHLDLVAFMCKGGLKDIHHRGIIVQDGDAGSYTRRRASRFIGSSLQLQSDVTPQGQSPACPA